METDNTNQPTVSAHTNPTPLKRLPLMIIGLSLLALLIGSSYFLLQKKNVPKVKSSLNIKQEDNPPVNQPLNQINNFQTLSLSVANFNDPETELYFSDANKVYKVHLDGSSPQEILSFPHNVGAVNITRSGDLLLSTTNSKYEKVVSKTPQDPDYKEIFTESHYWIVPKDTNKKEEIDGGKYRNFFDLQSTTTTEKIYTNILADGQAEILSDRLNGTPPTKIGMLKEKLLISVQVCEVGENCLEKHHPGEFIPSFDGRFLLNKPPMGGGLGTPGIVVSRDGSQVYKIDFYWYVSSAIWISNNKLLTKAQDGKEKVFTFNEDGTFSESILTQNIGTYFSQKGLSPTKEWLFIESNNPAGISLFDLNKQTVLTIEKEDRDELIKRYDLQDEIQIDPRIDHVFVFLGWNAKGDKFAYAETITPFANTQITNPTEIREIKVYDVNSHKISTIATLNPHPKNVDEYLLQGKPVSNIGLFAIK